MHDHRLVLTLRPVFLDERLRVLPCLRWYLHEAVPARDVDNKQRVDGRVHVSSGAAYREGLGRFETDMYYVCRAVADG